MRWKSNKGLKNGDIRRRKRFAFFPTTLSDGYTVWLEQYWVEEEWQEYGLYATGWRVLRTWCVKKARPDET